jgi:hypothetical protein
MLGTTGRGVLGALVFGLIGAAGCGSDDVARHEPGPAIAPASEQNSQPRAGAANGAPRISSVRFDPSEPGAGASVRAMVEVADPDGDGVRLGYAWSVNGESLAAHGAMLEIPATARRGSPIEVRVTASDGHAESEAFVVSTVIGNREPRLSGLVIQPAGHITASGPITAVATGSDPDGDPISFSYTWTVNDETADETGPVYPGERLKRGDVLQVSVVASDEQSESEPLVSPLIQVANAAPVIRSQPVLSPTDAAFSYRVVAEDPDGDRLRYGLANGPEGMTVLALSGEVDWTPRESQSGTHPVALWVEDAQGARVTQTFELSIGVSDAAAAKGGAPAAPAPAPASEEADAESPQSEEAEAE